MTGRSINEPYGSAGNPIPFAVDSLDPTEAVIGSSDVTLHVHGTGFRTGMVIVFNGGYEQTVFVSDTELTTVVKPSLAEVAGAFPVAVAAGDIQCAPQMFTFTEE